MADAWIRIPAIGAGNFKPSVQSVGDLPSVGNAVGDIRVVKDTADIYVWDGDSWELKSISSGNGSFKTMQTPLGSSPVAVSQADTLTWTSTESTVSITGNSATDTINLDITDGSILNVKINAAAAIARTKLASGSANHVIINDGSGVLSSEAKLALTRGGLGATTALSDAATIATDASTGTIFTVTLGGNRTLGAPTNPSSGQKVVWKIRQDGTGGRTLSYNAVFRFGNDVVSPTLSTSPNAVDYIGAIYNSTDAKWDVVAVARGYV
jgi:hypothetical protein